MSRETGLLREWPRSGPAVVWSASQLGAGYGSVAVAGSRVFVQGMKNRQSVVTSLDRAAGKAAWSVALGSMQENDRGSGPRSTPTVDGDRVYVLTENGDLVCLLSLTARSFGGATSCVNSTAAISTGWSASRRSSTAIASS